MIRTIANPVAEAQEDSDANSGDTQDAVVVSTSGRAATRCCAVILGTCALALLAAFLIGYLVWIPLVVLWGALAVAMLRG